MKLYYLDGTPVKLNLFIYQAREYSLVNKQVVLN